MFVLTDPSENNHNKFWEITFTESGSTCRWGRIGSQGQTKAYAGESENRALSRVSEKVGKGYQEVAVLGAQSSPATDSLSLAKLATDQIAGGDSELGALVRRLALANRHDIVKATGGAITFNADGLAQTALGLVHLDNVTQAREHLQHLARFSTFGQLDSPLALYAVREYLQLIPQKVGARRGWHVALFGTPDALAQQFDLLDNLENSIAQAQDELEQQERKAAPSERLFEVSLEKADNKTFSRLTTLFRGSINRAHVSANLRVKAAYRLNIPSMASAFESDGAKVGGIRELWHGTRTFNVLSILKSGLVVPKASAGHVNGRMFGDGLYFSDQATKSLNYSFGYWDRSGGTDSNCFMFIADVAMGRAYTPLHGRVSEPPRGYDSVYAQAGRSSVLNNEMIVYRTGQANLKYLLEFEQ